MTKRQHVRRPSDRSGASERGGKGESKQKGAAECTSVPLASWVALRRRYTRSVNLERELDVIGSVHGYIITPRAADALERIVEACVTPRAYRAFTLTGVYGTGKSAFAHFVAALVAAADNPARREALTILKQHPKARAIAKALGRSVGAPGMVRAVATAQREPLADTLLRALRRGAEALQATIPRAGRRVAGVLRSVRDLVEARRRGAPIDPRRVLALMGDLTALSPAGVLVVIDELGKSLEYASTGAADGDVFLLQQLAEMPTATDARPIVFLGLLHQPFTEYGTALASRQRLEWEKVQGRFEDIAFAEAPEHMLRLMAHAIAHDGAPAAARHAVRRLGDAWHKRLAREVPDRYVADVLAPEVIATLYPLHPVAALALPALCTRYAQHDRSLFTFLTSTEPHAFARFLRERVATLESVPTHKVADVYDYFVDVAGHGLSVRAQFQRWAEVHAVVEDARPLGPDVHAALKTVGALNLVTAAGPLRASRALVLAALADDPDDQGARARWGRVLDRLVERGLVTYREQLDEYRIWEGSDFDVSAAVRDYARADTRRVAAALTETVPLAPVIAQRHSFQTGTLRYFECRFLDGATTDLAALSCNRPDVDGLIVYWVDDEPPAEIPARTADGRPLVLITAAASASLGAALTDVVALRAVARSAVQLQTDGVARREVAKRLEYAERQLERAVRTAFDLRLARCWVEGRPERLNDAAFNARLSALCDAVYHRGATLWNELVNRRDLTSQGAKARRELIDAMLRRGTEPRLGITGDGPEATLYESILRLTGIHHPDGSVVDPTLDEPTLDEPGAPGGVRWTFGPPTTRGIAPLWQAIDQFCLESRTEPRPLTMLYERLEAPPHGIKPGMVPIILAAVLLYHADDVSVYYEGSFLPSLGPEHFELLVKSPGAFAVKHFEITGLRRSVFRELEDLVRRGEARRPVVPRPAARNATLLSVVSPLVRFATALPPYTSRTASVSEHARAVREALLSAREPDELLFRALPEACGLPSLIAATPADDTEAAQLGARLRQALLEALRELDGAYDRQLERCARLMHTAFGVVDDPSRLRAHLSVRAQYLLGNIVELGLKRFVLTAVNDVASPRDWLEGVVMVVADRPAETWTDNDAAAFEMRVSDMARRFTNIEALLRDIATTNHDGFDARRITITRADGREQHHVVWLDPHARDAVDSVVSEVLKQVAAFTDEQRRATAAAVAEELLSDRAPPLIAPVSTALSTSILAATAASRTRATRRASRE